MEMLIILIALLFFAAAAMLWGHDSRDGLESREWELRRRANYQDLYE